MGRCKVRRSSLMAQHSLRRIGKFTYHVVPEAGHYVHEDAPQRTANIIAEFFKRNDQNLFTLPPKVSEMLARGQKV